MNIKFILRDTAGKNGYKIRCYVQHNGRGYYNTKYSVQKSDWDERAGRVKQIRPNAQLMNADLIRLRNDIEGLCLKHPGYPAKDIVRLIGKKGTDTFLSFFENYIEECEAGKHKRQLGTVKKYRVVLNALEKFSDRTDFDTINKQWYEAYTGAMRKVKKNENTIGVHIKMVKSVLRLAYEAGVSANQEYTMKYFKKPSQPTDSIYLSEDDIKKWANVNLNNHPHLVPERDRSLIAYYFLLRFTDSISFNESNFVEINGAKFLKLDTGKTNIQVILPVKPDALRLLKKYKYQMPTVSNQEANWKIREIAILAKIQEVVTCNGKTLPKYDFVTSHTFRRSGATNLYLQKMPIKMISHLLGHNKVSTTELYIRVDRLESAKGASDYDFFK